MTRLKEEWICDMEATMVSYEKELEAKIALDFAGLAAAANDISRDAVLAIAQKETVAVVPITTGMGIIGTFADSVAAIIRQAGFSVFVTNACDVDGMYEAYLRKANMVFMADDNRYIGMHLQKNRMSDNNIGTARGYVKALEQACGSLKGKDVLVLGCGIVGFEIGRCLQEKFAKPIFYDKNEPLLQKVTLELGADRLFDSTKIRDYSFVMDATCEGGWMHEGMLHQNAWISTPGVPLSLDETMKLKYEAHTIHDWLQIGTLAMLGELCK